MAYTAWSVVYGEQPTAAKWNQLGANDAGFRDGSNFALGNNVIPANALATNAILLGYADTASAQGSIVGTETDLTNLTTTVTVPAGGRAVKLTASLWPSTTAAGDVVRCYFKEGSTYLGFHTFKLPDATAGFNQSFSIYVPAPSAGSHTYKLTMHRQSGSGTITSNAGAISASNTKPFLMAELV